MDLLADRPGSARHEPLVVVGRETLARPSPREPLDRRRARGQQPAGRVVECLGRPPGQSWRDRRPERAVRRSPNDGDARIMLGRALLAEKDYRGAAEQFRLVPYWSPKKPEALFVEGSAWFQLNRARDGEAAYLEYVNVDPNHPTPRLKRVEADKRLLELYALEDRWDEAHALIWRAYRDAGPSSRVELLEMSIRTKLERSLPSAALRELRR